MLKCESRLLWLPLVVLAAGILLLQPSAFSQTAQAPDIETPGAEASEDTVLTSIPIEDLPAASLSVTELIRDIESRLLSDSTLLAISELVPSAGDRVDSLCVRGESLLATQPTLRRLRNLQNDWQGLLSELGRWRKTLADRVSAIGLETAELAQAKRSWLLTEARAGGDRLPGEVVALIALTISDIDEMESALYRRRNELLLLEYDVAHLEDRCRNRIDVASASAERMRAELLVADTAPLWSPEAISDADDRIGADIRSALADYLRSLRVYVRSDLARVGTHLAIFIVAVVCITMLGKYARSHSENDPVMARAAEILRHAIPAAFLVAILADAAVHPHPPGAWALLLNLVLLVPLLVMAPRLVSPGARLAVYILAAVYLLDTGLEILPQHSIAGRLLKLGVKVTLILTALRLARWLYLPEGLAPGTNRKIATAALAVATGILAASAVTGIVGNESLATVLLDGTIESVYLGILVWMSVLVLRSMVTVILKTGPVRNTNLIRKHSEGLRLGILAAIDMAGVLVWFVVTLDSFKVLVPVYEGVRQVLASSFKIGSLEIATGGIALFLLIIWLSFIISRILRAILREEIYPRVRLAHGVPMAISRLAHYAILLIGFFFALGAAGIDLNRFTLLAGALGVGIGFGLQNIVNNLVSGLIVLFERPVQIGDKVKIGTNEGEIRRIGLRASVLRTWEGAEVIVPNSRLILDEVTNWTLSDRQRRIEVQVGVAYGSDTDKVTEVLLKVARDHDDVLDNPEPAAIFTGFGDSSLNFSLRAWTARFGDFFRVGSELTSAVNKALAEAGITIPFPQRDVHMKPDGKVPGKDT